MSARSKRSNLQILNKECAQQHRIASLFFFLSRLVKGAKGAHKDDQRVDSLVGDPVIQCHTQPAAHRVAKQLDQACPLCQKQEKKNQQKNRGRDLGESIQRRRAAPNLCVAVPANQIQVRENSNVENGFFFCLGCDCHAHRHGAAMRLVDGHDVKVRSVDFCQPFSETALPKKNKVITCIHLLFAAVNIFGEHIEAANVLVMLHRQFVKPQIDNSRGIVNA